MLLVPGLHVPLAVAIKDRPESRHGHCTERSAAAAAGPIAIVTGERRRRSFQTWLAEESSARAEDERALGFQAAATKVIVMRPAAGPVVAPPVGHGPAPGGTGGHFGSCR